MIDVLLYCVAGLPGVFVLWLFLGDPRVRLPFDPLFFVLALAHLATASPAHAQVASVFAYDPARATAVSADSSLDAPLPAAPRTFDPRGWASRATPPLS